MGGLREEERAEKETGERLRGREKGRGDRVREGNQEEGETEKKRIRKTNERVEEQGGR